MERLENSFRDGYMPLSHRSEPFTWHSSAEPYRWARALPIVVLCAVCAAAGYLIGRTAPNNEAHLGTKTLQTNTIAPLLEPEAPLARSAKAEGTHHTTGAHEGRPTPQIQPKPVAPVVVLINPNSAEKAKEAEKDTAASASIPSLHVESQDSAHGEEPRAEKFRRKKKVLSTSQLQERASQDARADGEADVRSLRSQSRQNFRSRYEPSNFRDYRDLRGYMLR